MSRFSDRDRLALGLSALVLDSSSRIDELILWVRHEGRRWLTLDVEQPVVLFVDGELLELEQLRASQPFIGNASTFLEKLEYRLSEADIERLTAGEEILLRLVSENGVAEKIIGPEKIAVIEGFHSELKDEIRGE